MKTKVTRVLTNSKTRKRLAMNGKRQIPEVPSRVLLSTGQAAGLLHVHVNTIRRWGNNGTLKSYRLGTRSDRRFDLGDVMSMLKRGTPVEE